MGDDNQLPAQPTGLLGPSVAAAGVALLMIVATVTTHLAPMIAAVVLALAAVLTAIRVETLAQDRWEAARYAPHRAEIAAVEAEIARILDGDRG